MTSLTYPGMRPHEQLHEPDDTKKGILRCQPLPSTVLEESVERP
jgi:hypothetical protein